MNNQNTHNHPLVSVITPGWNGKLFVHRLLDSIIAQTYDNMEYIYVDDGSTDGTKDIVLSYKEKFEARGIPFRYIYKENGGLCSAIQEGLKYVKGEMLCWPEYDDILLPEAMSKRVQYLQEHPDCAVVTCDAWITPSENLDKPTGLLSGNNPNRYDRNHFVQLLTGKSIFTAACHMVRMDVFDETHPNREIYQSRIGAIWQMLLPIYYSHNRGFIDEPLVKWVVRSDSVSNKHLPLSKRIQTINEFKVIRESVIDEIFMPNEDAKLYKSIVNKLTAESFIKYGMEYRDRDLFYKGYNFFQKNGIHITKDIRLKKLQIDYKVAYWAINLMNYLRNGFYAMFKKFYHKLYG